MKNVFIVNPCAGQGKGNDKFIEKIENVAADLGMPVSIHKTAGVGDGQVLARQIAQEATEEMRIFACGGDGTFNEVLNGVMEAEADATDAMVENARAAATGNASGELVTGESDEQKMPKISIGLIPMGTGNDFCRNFPEAGDFVDVRSQLLGSPVPCDAIRYSGMLDGRQQTRYCANMFNIGFDCNVVDLTATLKTYPLVAGSFAYLLAVFSMMVKKKGANLRVEVDGEVRNDGPLLLTAVANGCFCGGGVKSSPEARTDDGLMDYNIIRDVSRLDFIRLFPKYAKGTHLSVPGVERIIDTGKAKHITITPLNGEGGLGTMRLCTDGEIVDAEKIDMEIAPRAFSLVIPTGGEPRGTGKRK